MSPKQNTDLENFAKLLVAGTTKLFEERGGVTFAKAPTLALKGIIEYQGRMRVDGMEKFNNEPAIGSTVNFFANAQEMAKNKTLGALVVLVDQGYLPRLMKTLQYPAFDDEDENALMDSCGTLCNIIAGKFKSEILAAGYIDLEMSAFNNFRNNPITGIDFCFAEYSKYEISFLLDNEKHLVLEITMGTVPRK